MIVLGFVLIGYSKLKFDGNVVLSGGLCIVILIIVKFLEDLVIFFCNSYSDLVNLIIELYYRVKSYSADGKELVGLYYGSLKIDKIFVVLWLGIFRYIVQIKIFVEDEYGV